ncbi:MAG: septum formation protein Maf [Bdellovibrio sp.]|nr:MAG: septum formation protein Maf [Bdellovibrio sp.]
MKIVLVSTSPYRKKQLQQLIDQFETLPPLIEEESIKNHSLPPKKFCLHLAYEKAKSRLSSHPEALLIGADQIVLSHSGKILGKTSDAQEAAQQLQSLSGKTHHLLTAVALLHKRKTFQHVNVTKITFYPISFEEALKYVQEEQTWDCAGACKIEEKGIRFVKSIETEDFTAITGLPLLTLNKWFRELKVL